MKIKGKHLNTKKEEKTMTRKTVILTVCVLFAAVCALAFVNVNGADAKASFGTDCFKSGCHKAGVAPTKDSVQAAKPAQPAAPAKSSTPAKSSAPAKPSATKPAAAKLPAAKTATLKINDKAEKVLMVNGTTLVPVAKISEIAKVSPVWDGTKKTITIKSASTTIVLTVGKDTAVVNGQEIKLEAAARETAGVSYAPLRFIAEKLGLKVDFANNSIKVYKPIPTPQEALISNNYVGSETCGTCHPDAYKEWNNNHGNFAKDVSKDPSALKGNFEGNYPKAIGFGKNDIQYALNTQEGGLLHGQELVGKRGTFGVPADDYPVMWSTWNMKDKEWETEVEAWGEGTPWLSTCAGCHVTNIQVPTAGKPDTPKGFFELGIACENCHGPGKEHASNPTKDNIIVSSNAANCGQCHTRGASAAKRPDGKTYGFPYNEENGNYEAGMDLAEFYTHVSLDDVKSFWPTGHARNSHHVQYPEWLATDHSKALEDLKANDHATDECLGCHSADYITAKEGNKPTLQTAQEGLSCQACHDSHNPTQFRTAKEELCGSCHNAEGATVGSAVHHPQKELNEGLIGVGVELKPSVMAEAGVNCIDCHMPKTTGPDPSHNMHIVTPKVAQEYGMPNDSCMGCHPGAKPEYIQARLDKWQSDVKAELEAVGTLIEAKASFKDNQAYKEAKFNYDIVLQDGSTGAHNYELAMDLLKAAKERLNSLK